MQMGLAGKIFQISAILVDIGCLSAILGAQYKKKKVERGSVRMRLYRTFRKSLKIGWISKKYNGRATF